MYYHFMKIKFFKKYMLNGIFFITYLDIVLKNRNVQCAYNNISNEVNFHS